MHWGSRTLEGKVAKGSPALMREWRGQGSHRYILSEPRTFEVFSAIVPLRKPVKVEATGTANPLHRLAQSHRFSTCRDRSERRDRGDDRGSIARRSQCVNGMLPARHAQRADV